MTSMLLVVSAADLATCDREPIHVGGGIQPHGVLLTVAGPVLNEPPPGSVRARPA